MKDQQVTKLARRVMIDDPFELAQKRCLTVHGKTLDQIETVDEYMTALTAVGRNNGPSILMMRLPELKKSPELMARVSRARKSSHVA